MRLRERSASSTRRCSLESLIRRLRMGRALVAFSRPSLTGRNHWTPRPSTGSWSPAVSRLRSAAYVSIQTRRCLIEQDVLSAAFMPQESWWVGSSTTTIREVVALWPGQCSDAALALVRPRMHMSRGKSALLGVGGFGPCLGVIVGGGKGAGGQKEEDEKGCRKNGRAVLF